MNPQPADTRIGQVLDDRYQITREIAVGGMGTVYEAKHIKLGRTVAIKILHPDMAANAEAVARFINEARVVGTLGHPNIVASTDFGELPGKVPYLVLEYLSGRTLAGMLGTTLLTVLMFWGCSRFVFPLDAFLLPLSVVGLAGLAARCRDALVRSPPGPR